MPVTQFALILTSVLALGGATVALLAGFGASALLPVAAATGAARLARGK